VLSQQMLGYFVLGAASLCGEVVEEILRPINGFDPLRLQRRQSREVRMESSRW
jgi:hypothetical protein